MKKLFIKFLYKLNVKISRYLFKHRYVVEENRICIDPDFWGEIYD